VKAIAPDLQLIHRGRAECVCRSKKQRLALGLKALCKFGNSGGFPGAIYADDHDHGGFTFPIRHGRGVKP
jgi:hypothetical protein